MSAIYKPRLVDGDKADPGEQLESGNNPLL